MSPATPRSMSAFCAAKRDSGHRLEACPLPANLAKQCDLPIRRALPVELLGIGPGRGPVWRSRENFANRCRKALRRCRRDDPPGLRRADDIGDARQLRDDNRGATGHALEQDVGPALTRRGQQQYIGRAVDLRQPVLRQPPKEMDTLGDSPRPRHGLDRRALRAVADDDQIYVRQQSGGFDHQPVALQHHEVADREYRRPGKAERPPRRSTVAGLKQHEIDPVAQNSDSLGGNPKVNQAIAQPARYGDQTIRLGGRPGDPAPRHAIAGDQIEITAPCSHDNRPANRPPQHYRRNTIRVEIVRVDQREVAPCGDLPAQFRQHCREQGGGSRAHADLWQ